MRKKIVSMLLLATLTMAAFTGCGNKEKENDKVALTPTATVAPEATVTTEELDAAGSVDGLTYTNSLVGFSISVPENWEMKDSEGTYDYLVNVAGMADDINSLKSSLASQGTSYLCYGIDTELSESGGTDNIIAQSVLSQSFGDMGVETIISSLSAMINQQYTSLGATCTVEEPVKITIDDQDVYQFTISATMSKDSAGKEINQTIRQEYIVFMRNDVLVYMAVTTSEEDSAALVQQFVDTLSFQ